MSSLFRIGVVSTGGLFLLLFSWQQCVGESESVGIPTDRSDISRTDAGNCQETIPLMVGVLDFETNQVTDSDARTIADRMRIYLNRSDVFEVLERRQMNEILEEQGFQLSGACDTDECVIQVGRIIGARKMIAGSVSRVGKVFSLQVRIIDVSTGRIEETAFADTRGTIEDVLRKATLEAAMKLIATVRETLGIPPPRDRIEEELRLYGQTGPISLPDGWYMRVNIGAGSLDLVTEEHFAADMSGTGLSMDFGIGMTLDRRTSVTFEFAAVMAMAPTLDYGDWTVMSSTDTTAGLMGIMVGITHYLIRRSLYVSLLAGFSNWDLTTEGYNESSIPIAEGSVGSGFQLLLGKDWWLNRKVGFGLALRALRYSKATSYGAVATFIWDF